MIPFLDEQTRVLLRDDLPSPRIGDAGLAAVARTRSTRFHVAPSAASWHDQSRFELLESLGDCITTAAIGRAIYAHVLSSDKNVVQPGVFKTYRDLLTSNYTFSQLVLIYGLHANLQPPIAVTWTDWQTMPPSTVKRLGDVFEAYVGALDADGKREEVDQWLYSIARRLCSLAEQAAARFDLAAVPVGSTGSEPFISFVRVFQRERDTKRKLETDPAPSVAADCSCWKRGLSLYVQTHGLRYDMQTDQVHRTRVTLPDGRFWEGDGGSKQRAEQQAAKTALLFLDSEWAAQRPHEESCPRNRLNHAREPPTKRQRAES